MSTIRTTIMGVIPFVKIRHPAQAVIRKCLVVVLVKRWPLNHRVKTIFGLVCPVSRKRHLHDSTHIS